MFCKQILLVTFLMSWTSFVCTQLNGSKYNKGLNNSFGPIDRTLTDTTTPGQREPGRNGDEGVLLIPQRSRTGISLSDRV